LDNAVSRLEGMCQEWLHIQSSVNDLPPEASELISAAVGVTRLLLRGKFSQFCDLINKCEKSLAGETDTPVTCLDLEGFWDMVFIQVEELVIPNLYLVTEVQSHIFGKLVELIMHIPLQFSVL